MRSCRTTLLLLLLLAGCGRVFVDPIQSGLGSAITASSEKPNVMFVLDKSGSMAAPLPDGTGCAACQFPHCDEASCPTRMGQLRVWSAALLAELGSQASWGLEIFPADAVCSPAGAAQVLTPISTDGAARAATQIANQAVAGGTPTGPTLTFTNTVMPHGTAADLVLLVTDGLPNCDAANANVCTQPTACKCTLAGANCGTTVDDTDPNNFCRRGCLALDSAVAAANQLARDGVFTLTVGFGADFGSGDGLAVLSALSTAGASGQKCVSDSDCVAAARCMAERCSGGLLTAGTAAQLQVATNALKKKLELSTRCRWKLAKPVTTLHVELAGVTVPATDVDLERPDVVRLLGQSCTRLVDDPALSPVFQEPL